MYSTPFSRLLLSFGVFWQNDSYSIHKLHSAEGRLNKTRRCVGESLVGIENQISQRFLLTCAPTKVCEGKVVEMGNRELPDCKIDCSGLLVAPGLIDLQVCAITASFTSRLVINCWLSSFTCQKLNKETIVLFSYL